MSLDLELYMEIDTGGKDKKRVILYEGNITHNLNAMADKAGLYQPLWHPKKLVDSETIYAMDIVKAVRAGYHELKSYPIKYKQYDSENGWGIYDDFLPFVKKYLDALIEHPNAMIYVSI